MPSADDLFTVQTGPGKGNKLPETRVEKTRQPKGWEASTIPTQRQGRTGPLALDDRVARTRIDLSALPKGSPPPVSKIQIDLSQPGGELPLVRHPSPGGLPRGGLPTIQLTPLITPEMAGTLLSFDPITAMMGNSGRNIGTVADPLANYINSWAQIFGAAPRDPEFYEKEVSYLQSQTPEFVRRLQEFLLGGHGAAEGIPRAPTPAEFARRGLDEPRPIAGATELPRAPQGPGPSPYIQQLLRGAEATKLGSPIPDILKAFDLGQDIRDRSPELDLLREADARGEVQQTTAAKGIRQRMREFQGGPISGEPVAERSPWAGAPQPRLNERGQTPAEAEFWRQFERRQPGDFGPQESRPAPLSTQRQREQWPAPDYTPTPATGRPDYMATPEEIAQFRRTPEQIKAEKEQARGRRTEPAQQQQQPQKPKMGRPFVYDTEIPGYTGLVESDRRKAVKNLSRDRNPDVDNILRLIRERDEAADIANSSLSGKKLDSELARIDSEFESKLPKYQRRQKQEQQQPRHFPSNSVAGIIKRREVAEEKARRQYEPYPDLLRQELLKISSKFEEDMLAYQTKDTKQYQQSFFDRQKKIKANYNSKLVQLDRQIANTSNEVKIASIEAEMKELEKQYKQDIANLQASRVYREDVPITSKKRPMTEKQKDERGVVYRERQKDYQKDYQAKYRERKRQEREQAQQKFERLPLDNAMLAMEAQQRQQFQGQEKPLPYKAPSRASTDIGMQRQQRMVPEIPTGRVPGGEPQFAPGYRSGIPRPTGPRGGKVKPPKLKTQAARTKALDQAWAQIQKVASPSTISKPAREAAQIIRQTEGLGKRQVASALHKMNPYMRDIRKLDYQGKRDLVGYIQGNKNAPVTPRLVELTDKIRSIYKGYENEILGLERFERQDFMENYLTNMWKEKLEADRVFKAGTWLKERKLPTYEDGIAKGLTPVTLDPIEIVNRYMASMRLFLDRQYIIQQGRDAGYIKSDTGKGIRPPGTEYLKSGRVPIRGGKNGFTMYATDDFARVFNHYISHGFRETDIGAEVYDALLKTANGATMLSLMFPAFHTFVMTAESYIAAGADVFKSLSEGKAPSLEKYRNSAIAPYAFYKKGDQLIKAYLGDNAQGRLGHIAELGAKANMRLGELDQVYRPTAMGNFIETFKHLGFKETMKQTGREMIPTRSKPLSIFSPVAVPLSKVADTVAWPIFYHYIPRLKAGVFMERMGDFLDKNRSATMEEQVAYAQRLADVIDDQFGELVQNNLFWDNHIKQAANLLQTSTGWNVGTLRLFGQGTVDILKNIAHYAGTRVPMLEKNLKQDKTGTYVPKRHQPLTDRGAYVLSSAVVGVFTMGAIYYALKYAASQILGTPYSPPGMNFKDFAVPLTGGKTAHGDPERVILPGYTKDIMGWVHAPMSELYNKLNTQRRLELELLMNRDWQDDPTRNNISEVIARIGAAINPISLQQLTNPSSPKTNVGPLERFLGIRAAGGWITNPEKTSRIERYMQLKAEAKKRMHEVRDKAKRRPAGELFTPNSPRAAPTTRKDASELFR